MSSRMFRGSVQSTGITFVGQFDNQGGGPKKAGLPDSRNKGYLFPIAKKVHPTRDTLANYGNPIVYGLTWTNPAKRHKALRPIWSTLSPVPYWNMSFAMY